MKKLKLQVDSLQVESFQPHAPAGARGTVRGQLTAYYELCHVDDTWQMSCTCEPTCNAQTCYNCGSAACGTANCGTANCSGNCNDFQTIALTNCDFC